VGHTCTPKILEDYKIRDGGRGHVSGARTFGGGTRFSVLLLYIIKPPIFYVFLKKCARSSTAICRLTNSGAGGMCPRAPAEGAPKEGCGNFLRDEIYKHSASSVEAGMGLEGQIMCTEKCPF